MSRANTDIPMTTHAAERRGALLREARAMLSLDGEDMSRRGLVSPCASLFLTLVERERLVHVCGVEVPRERVDVSDDLEGVELSWRGRGFHDAVLTLPGGPVAAISCHHGQCEVHVAATSGDEALREAARLGDLLRDPPPPSDAIQVHFWSAGSHRALADERSIDTPHWPDIAGNYPAATRAAVGTLVGARGPGAGSLLLWHGPPGTGKTHALRALAHAWRDWSSVHYVTDPEHFLAGTRYLIDVATDDEDDGRVRLVVLEDAGELMAADARTTVGQGLSRVLNLADGMLGQGVPCVLLVTTNEPIGRLHPAVRRPGRCWAEVHFPAFGADEATAWLALRGVDRPQGAPATLAELYALAEGRELVAPAAEPFGFGRGA